MGKFLLKALLFAVIVLFANAANCQLKKPGITLGASLMYNMPKGAFSNGYSFGGGGEVFGGLGIGQTFIVGTLGYSKFKARSGNPAGTLTYAPVKLGVKQFLFARRLFVNFDLGVASVKNKSFNEGLFTRGFGAGARLLGLEVALYYDGFKNKNASGFSNSLNAKMGWSFSL